VYGKDDQILYSARFSQGFKVVAAKRTWQAAGVSGGDTKIRVRQSAETLGKVPAERVVKSCPIRLFLIVAID
jgi:hypothetical protein